MTRLEPDDGAQARPAEPRTQAPPNPPEQAVVDARRSAEASGTPLPHRQRPGSVARPAPESRERPVPPGGPRSTPRPAPAAPQARRGTPTPTPAKDPTPRSPRDPRSNGHPVGGHRTSAAREPRRPAGAGHPDAAGPTTLAVSPRPVYLPALDGLRAISVAAVVAFHLGRLPGGFIGVDIFFVISGFLITRLLLAERERNGLVDFVNFWGRRFRRLLPALLVVLTWVCVVARFWMPSWRWADLRIDALATLGYVANWRFVLSGQSYFDAGVAPSPLRHAWSLAIEEQFYLIWPLVVLAVLRYVQRRFRLILMVVAGSGALLSAGWMALAAGMDKDLSRLYYGTDTRAFALLSGAWLAAWWDPVVADAPRPVGGSGASRPLTRAAVVALVPLAVLAVVGSEDTSWFYRIGFQSVAVLATVAVAGLATGEGRVSAAIGSPALRWLGRRSYGIYLWSWPVQVYASSHFGLDGLMLDIVVVAVTMAMATLSFRFIEEPIRTQWGRPKAVGKRAKEGEIELRFPMVFRFGVALLLVAALVSASTSGGDAAPSYMKVSDAEAAASALDASSGFTDAPAGGERISVTQPSGSIPTTTALVPPTTLPAPTGPPGPFSPDVSVMVDPAAAVDPWDMNDRPLRVMIAGDSVGWSLGWEPSADLTSSVAIEDRAIIGCGVMPPASYWVVEGRGSEQYSPYCLEQADAERIGLESGPDVALLWLGAWEVYDHIVFGQELKVFSDEYAKVVEQRLQERIDQYRAAGVPTIMPTVPCFGPVAPRLGKERHHVERRNWVNERLIAVAERNRTWVRVIDPTSTLCDTAGKSRETTPEGLPIRADGAHFDTDSAAWFWNNWLAGQLGAAFAGL